MVTLSRYSLITLSRPCHICKVRHSAALAQTAAPGPRQETGARATLFCLRDLIIGFGFGAITGGVAAGLFSRTKFTVKRVLIKGAIIGCLLGGAASIVVAYDTYFAHAGQTTVCRLSE